MDLLAFYRGQRFIVETKIWYGKADYEEGKAQLLRYLQAAGLPKGSLVIFDEHLEKNPLLKTHGDNFEISVGGKTMRVYLIGHDSQVG